MAQKQIHISEIGNIVFYKRRNTRSIKIKISGSDIKVTLPYFVPYAAAVKYLESRKQWIIENLAPRTVISYGDKFGKNIVLNLQKAKTDRFTSSHKDEILTVKIPSDLDIKSDLVQDKLTKYIQKALQRESEQLLLPIVRKIANANNLQVKSIQIKNLKSRWGSCSSNKDLAFSLYLIQLPWHCIHYVIYHELAHTVYMNHGHEFWQFVGQFEVNYKNIKKEMKNFSPHIILQT